MAGPIHIWANIVDTLTSIWFNISLDNIVDTLTLCKCDGGWLVQTGAGAPSKVYRVIGRQKISTFFVS